MPDIKAQTADGNVHVFPDGTAPEVIDRVIKQYVQSKGPMTEAGAAAKPPIAPVAPGAFQQTPESIGAQMKTSAAPSIVRGTAQALPVIGGTAGALIGAPAGGAGAVGGAALGASGGEAAGQLLTRATLGEGPATSKEAAKDIGIAGATAAALEVPGALLQGSGRIVLNRLAAAKDARQVGDVLDAVDKVRPYGLTRRGIVKDLDYASKSLSKQFGEAVSNSKAAIKLDSELAPAMQQAATADQSLKGISKRVESEFKAAKLHAGIKGDTATAEQLADFRNYIQRRAFKVTQTSPVGASAQEILKNAYSLTGQTLRREVPEAAPILDQMTDIHAANDAVKNYMKGQKYAVGKAAAISAATHPRTTALASPLIPIAPAAAEYGRRKIEQYVPIP